MRKLFAFISFVTIVVALCLASSCLAQITAPVADQIKPVEGSGHDYIHLLNETINPQTGSVSIRIGVPLPAGRGLSAPFSFSYDSNAAHHGANWQDNASYSGAGGWSFIVPSLTFSSGNVVGPAAAGEGAGTPQHGVGQQIGCNYSTGYMFEDASGTMHSLKLTNMDVYATSGNMDCYYVNYWMEQYLTGGDASVTASTPPVLHNNDGGQPVTVSDNDGTVYYFAHNPSHSGGLGQIYMQFPDTMTDRNGNVISFHDNGTGTVTITDTLGRTAVAIYGSATNGMANQVQISGLGTYTPTWTQQNYNQTYHVQEIPPANEPSQPPYWVCHGAIDTRVGGSTEYFTQDTIPVLSSSTSAPPGNPMPTPLNVITKLQLPNGQSYQFQYDSTYGLLSKVIYPDGAYSRYVWTTNAMTGNDISGSTPTNNAIAPYPCELIYDEPALLQKFTSFDGVNEVLEQDYSYSTTWASSVEAPYQKWTAKQTTVTSKVSTVVNGAVQPSSQYKTIYNYVPVPVDPTGVTITLQQRQAVVPPVNPAEASIVSEDAVGNVLKVVNKTYNDFWSLPNDEKDTLENGQTMENKRAFFGASDVVSDLWTYDYGGASGSALNPSAPGALLVHKHADYNTLTTPLYPSGTTIIDRAKDIITYDGNGNRVAESDFCFDGDTSAFNGCAPSLAVKQVSAVQHDETHFSNSYVNGRGNVTTAIARCFVGSSACAQGDSIAEYTWDTTGQMQAKTDANGNSTHYFFTDSFDTTPGSTQATYSTASVTISGFEQSTLVGAQNIQMWDTGTVTIVVNGESFSAQYGQTSTTSTIVQALVTAINGSSSYVTATQSGNVVNLQAKLAGGYEYPLEISVNSTFNLSSFSAAASGPLVSGGVGSIGIGSTNAYLTGITDALGHTESYQYAFGDGQLIQTTGENSELTNFYYQDPLRRLTSIHEANGGQTLKAYNEASYPPNVVTQKQLDSSRFVTSTAILDGSTHVTQSQLNSDPQGMTQATSSFDGLGRAYLATNAFRSTSDPTYASSTTQFDALGRAVKLTRQDNSTVTTSYSGTTTTVTDEAGNQRRSFTNALGQLIEVDEPGDNYPATPAIAAPTPQVTGTLRSVSGVGAYSATQSKGWVSIGGTESSKIVGAQNYTLWDTGQACITIANQTPACASYGQGTAASDIASALYSAINGDSGLNYFVSASLTGATINLTAKGGGAQTWPVSASVTSSQGFSPPSFSASTSGSITGGKNGYAGTTLYDYGNATVSVGSWTSAPAPYGQNGNNAGNNTAPLVAQALLSVLNASSSPVSAVLVNGNGLVITCKTLGTACNGDAVTISSATSDTTHFSGGSFSGAATMMGGGGNAEASSLAIPFVTLYKYDTLGNLLCVEQHGDATNGTGCSSYPTPTAGDPWRPRMFTYDSLGHLLTAYNPESGTIAFSYDKNGNVVTKTDARGITENYSPADSPIDPLNRVTKVTFSNGDPAITYTYDQGQYGNGHRTGMTDASGSTSWTYDIMGQIASETRTINPGPGLTPVTRTISYQYDLAGNPTQITYPDGTQIKYAEDNAGRDISATDMTHGINYITNATYAPVGDIASFTEGAGTTTITNSFVYNPRLQICREMASTVGITPQSCTDGTHVGNLMDFQYDFHVGTADNGNLYTAANNKDSSRTQTYSYDTLNRLYTARTQGTLNAQGQIDCTVMVAGSTTQTKYWGETFAYDAWGNLTGKTSTLCNAENATLTVNANNQLLSAGYNAAGDMVNNGGATYSYNGESEMVSAGGYTYLYDGDGNRVAKTNGSSGTLYWYGAPGIVLETDLLGNPQSEYVFFGESRIARRDVSGVSSPVYYYFANQIHSTALITDANGNIEDDADYYPWGGTLQFSTNLPNHYWFSGKIRDEETGFDYFGARYYGNSFGRFTQPDWSAKAEGVPYADYHDPQSLNLYGYVRDNPITQIDPDGHFTDFYDENGNKTGDDGNNDGRAVLVAKNGNKIDLGSKNFRSAVGDAVNRSNSATKDDTKGGFHEEGVVEGHDANGNLKISNADPGPVSDPAVDPHATIDMGTAINKGGLVDVKSMAHVHPSGKKEQKSSSSKPTTSNGMGITLGGTRKTTTKVTTNSFTQEPSKNADVASADNSTTNIVVGAGNQTVYFYNSSGTQATMPLDKYKNIP